jgi:hypothetical protein
VLEGHARAWWLRGPEGRRTRDTVLPTPHRITTTRDISFITLCIFCKQICSCYWSIRTTAHAVLNVKSPTDLSSHQPAPNVHLVHHIVAILSNHSDHQSNTLSAASQYFQRPSLLWEIFALAVIHGRHLVSSVLVALRVDPSSHRRTLARE